MKKFLLIIALVFFIVSCNKAIELQPQQNVKYVSYGQAKLSPNVDFKTKKTGNFSDTSVWMKYDGTSWIDAHDIPDTTNSIFIEAGNTLIIDSIFSCKDINLNSTADTIRISTGGNDISVYGKMRGYTGTAPGTSSTASGIAGWISGKITLKGSTRTVFNSGEFSANSHSAGWTLNCSINSTAIAYVNTTIRCGYLVVTSGTLYISGIPDGLTSSQEIRIAGDDYTAQPGNGISGGTCDVKSGATLVGSRFRKNSPLSVGNSLASFTLDSGATFIANVSDPTIATVNYSLNGTVKLTLLENQYFISNYGNVDAINIIKYNNIVLGGSGSKSLKYNTQYHSLQDLDSLLNLNGYTLTLY
jgi:hypothetical protein